MRNLGLLLRFSTREFFTQFLPNRAKVSRTYFWLTCFFSLAMTFSLVFIGAGEGLVSRFADAVLGHVDGAGVPIQVQNKLLNQRRIDVAAINRLQKEQKILLHPYLEVNRYQLDLPACDGAADLFVDDWWHGMAITDDNPLWPKSNVNDRKDKHNFPLTIVLNRAVFNESFDYDCYKRKVSKLLPEVLIQNSLPATLDQLKVLWLKTNGGSGQGRESVWLPYHIEWTSAIGGINKTAFLLPLSTFKAFQFVQKMTNTRFYYEGDGEVRGRFNKLAIYTKQRKISAKEMAVVLHCLNSTLSNPTIEIIENPDDDTITGLNKLPKQQIESCLEPYEIAKDQYKYFDKTDSHLIIFDREYMGVRASCEAKPVNNLYQCIDGLFGRRVSFGYALAYIDDIHQLKRQLDILQNFEIAIGNNQLIAFEFSAYYTDAIKRFDFVANAINKIGWALTSVVVLFFTFLIGTEVGVLVGHRKRYFAKYLTSFLSSRQLFFSFYWQISLAASLGFLVSLVIVHFIRDRLNSDFQEVVQLLGYSLNLDPNRAFDLLPLALNAYSLVFFGFTLTAWVACHALLKHAKLSPKVEITEYLVD